MILDMTATLMTGNTMMNLDSGAEDKRRSPDGSQSVRATVSCSDSSTATETNDAAPQENRGYPFFYYIDHSKDEDPDPFYPLVPPGETPNFPAKLHAILSAQDHQGVIAWLPHGRSWVVLKPKQFELVVLPKFFSHSKYSSFVRQANGWGFKRVREGPNRGSYYHPKFLRGLPYLCKTLKRQRGKKESPRANCAALPKEQDPDFYKISQICPLSECTEQSFLLIANGRSGFQSMHGDTSSTIAASPLSSSVAAASSSNNNMELLALMATTTSSGASIRNQAAPPSPVTTAPEPSLVPDPMMGLNRTELSSRITTASLFLPPGMPSAFTFCVPCPENHQQQQQGPAAAVNMPVNMNASPVFMMVNPGLMQQHQGNQVGTINNQGSSFAAGFAAAAAFSQQHFGKILESMMFQQQQQQQQQQL